jgi:hypothetical protein
VFTEACEKMAVVWVVALCNLKDVSEVLAAFIMRAMM